MMKNLKKRKAKRKGSDNNNKVCFQKVGLSINDAAKMKDNSFKIWCKVNLSFNCNLFLITLFGTRESLYTLDYQNVNSERRHWLDVVKALFLSDSWCTSHSIPFLKKRHGSRMLAGKKLVKSPWAFIWSNLDCVVISFVRSRQ